MIFAQVTCGANSDCSTIPGRSDCKYELGLGELEIGEKTCRPTSECSCSDDEFCVLESFCYKSGTFQYFPRFSLNKVLAFCSSNSDCESSSTTPICKEVISGGSKICQAPKSCTRDCLPAEFCADGNICRAKGKLPGNYSSRQLGKLHRVNNFVHFIN